MRLGNASMLAKRVATYREDAMNTSSQDSTGPDPTISVIITKTERHQVDYFFEFELDANKLAEIYPEHDEDHLAQLMDDIKSGIVPVEAILADATDANVDIPWASDGEDVLTLKSGHFDQTFGISDD